jgi:hypothetical protein
MHPLHDYVAKQLADKVKSRRIVVWYDERSEFLPFVDELRGGRPASSEPVVVALGGSNVWLAQYAGSMFELRSAVEPQVSGDSPEAVVIYIPGCARDGAASVLMELEKAGKDWSPQLKQLARNVLLQRYTLGVVDDLLPFDRKVSYEELARACSDTASTEPPSILKSIFHDASGNDGLLAAWLVSDARDDELAAKDANRELCKLVRSRLELDLAEDLPLGKMRSIVLRYVLANEFRSDYRGEPPASLSSVANPKTRAGAAAVRELAQRLRKSFAAEYAAIADQVQHELRLLQAPIVAEHLGSIDTFRFEERALLKHCGELIANRQFDAALKIVAERDRSFWVESDITRKTHWDACRLMANLGVAALRVHAALRNAPLDAAGWIDAYVRDWCRLDQAQRHLEARVQLARGRSGRAGIERRAPRVRRHVPCDGDGVCPGTGEGAMVGASGPASDARICRGREPAAQACRLFLGGCHALRDGG